MSSFAGRLIALGAVMIWLNGCASTVSKVAMAHVCPPVVEYPAATQEQAASDLYLLPPGSPVVSMLGDYAVLRDQLRACR